MAPLLASAHNHVMVSEANHLIELAMPGHAILVASAHNHVMVSEANHLIELALQCSEILPSLTLGQDDRGGEGARSG